MSSRPALPGDKTPLDVLLHDMNFWSAKAEALAAAVDALVLDGSSEESVRKAAEVVGAFTAARQRAVDAAIAAAPFVHARVTASAVSPMPPYAVDSEIPRVDFENLDQLEASKAYMRLVGAPLPTPKRPAPSGVGGQPLAAPASPPPSVPLASPSEPPPPAAAELSSEREAPATPASRP